MFKTGIIISSGCIHCIQVQVHRLAPSTLIPIGIRQLYSLGYTSEILCHRRTWLRDILFLNNALRKHDYIHNHTVGKKTCLKTLAESSQLFSRIRFESKQEAQLSQRDRAMLRVIEYFAKSLKGHSRSFEMTLSRRE